MLRDKRIDKKTQQIAHDIRSPLFALQAVLESSGEFNEAKRKLLYSVVQRLNDIADGILFEKSNVESTNLKTLIQEIVTEKTIIYPDFKFNFYTSEDVVIALDPTEMKRVVSNLIQNSIEAYEGKPGEIKISLVSALGVSKITVSDNGKGIPLSLIPTIYGKSHNKEGGSGLGLSHAKNYIESLNGKLEITSIPCEGTEVSISL